MKDDTKAHFKELTVLEKQSKLSFVANQKIKVTLWQKGVATKYQVYTTLFLIEDFILVLKADSVLDETVRDYLYNFSINGVSFFGKCIFKSTDSKLSLDCSGVLYKSERRKNYRLLAYPHYKSYAEIELEEIDITESNVVSLNTKKSTTGLFKNFLELVSDNDTVEKPALSFRVFDLSVTGISLMFGDIEYELLKELDEITDLTVKLDVHEFQIEKAEICYILDLVGDTGYSYRAGIKFLDMDTNLDNKIGFIINQFLRDTDSEFEDFLK
jgi:hypothetical protein